MSLSQIELVWVRVLCKIVQSKMTIKDGCHHQVKWEWIVWSDWISLSQNQSGVRVFWLNLREDNKVSESKMAVSESTIAEFKMAAIIKLSQNDLVNFFCAKWLNPRWQNLRWLPSSSWVRMNEWRFFVQMVATNLSKCEWVWEEILWWLNPRCSNSRWQNSRWLPSWS